jgi:methionyl aminopeptidase
MPPSRWNHPDILKERKQEIPRRSFFGVALTMQPKKNRIFAQLKMEEAMFKRKIRNWRIPRNGEITEFDKKILAFQNKGELVPTRELVKTPEQIEGIRRSGVVNTGVLDLIQKEIHVGMSTLEIDQMVYDYTVAHGAIPAPLGYEGFPKSVCTSINEVVCHGIPSADEILEEGDIINVDVSTILDGYYSDASRMFTIGKTSPEKEALVRVAKECLEIGAAAAKPWGFVGDIGKAIEKHARKNGFSVVRDLCGHGVGLEFHEDPEVDHYNTHRHGMLLVPGMVFTIEPMINMGDWNVFIDEEDGWTVVTEDELPSAQWEHTFLMTENGLEILSE